MTISLINAAYVVAATLFILGLRGLASPRTARRGNLLGAVGMLLAVLATLIDRKIIGFELIIIGLIVGAAIGAVLAVRVQLTAMPQLVASFNGFGGAASALVAGTAVVAPTTVGAVPLAQLSASSALSAVIGITTFAGSMVAFAKLQEVMRWQPRGTLGLRVLTAALALGGAALVGVFIYDSSIQWAFWALLGVWAVVGVLLTVPIGGADMPVVIALLNSFSGLAAAATGFVLGNNALIISGALVGASGLILTAIMSRAMNRSVRKVLFTALAPAEGGPSAADMYEGRVRSASAEEAALIFETARLVVVVPGYGMAVAQAQHAVRDLANLVQERGGKVRYAIHPVAGRMPGHMNVLLAEADIPYDQLLDLDASNGMLPQADIALVIGANDVVNPAARDEVGSPIYGMPIVDVDKAATVMVIKRSLSPGFAGIPNELFANPNTVMLFGDGNAMVREIIGAMKE